MFSRSKLRDSVKGITDLYSAIGRASADVEPEHRCRTSRTGKVNITFEIIEGPEVFVERINIAGNTRSQEKILRREIPMAEGDLFTSQKLARAKQRLTNLNYFDKVEAKTAPGSAKDKIIVNIDVTEKPTGLFSIGGGYSSQDGVLGTLDLSQRNFLGKGWEVFLRLRGGARTSRARSASPSRGSSTGPLAAGFDIFNNRRILHGLHASTRSAATSGSGIRSGSTRAGTRVYRVSQDKVSDVDPTAAARSCSTRRGPTSRRWSGLELTRDTRDSVFEPTRGSTRLPRGRLRGRRLRREVRSARSSTTTYFQPSRGSTTCSSVRLMAGYSLGWCKDPVPLFERFYLGGPNSIRSFKSRQISPEDSTGTRIGGNIQVLGDLEYTVPLFFGIRAAVFFDVGNVWGPDICAGTRSTSATSSTRSGAGLRWNSPFGPIRVDYGVNPTRRRARDSAISSSPWARAF